MAIAAGRATALFAALLAWWAAAAAAANPAVPAEAWPEVHPRLEVRRLFSDPLYSKHRVSGRGLWSLAGLPPMPHLPPASLARAHSAGRGGWGGGGGSSHFAARVRCALGCLCCPVAVTPCTVPRRATSPLPSHHSPCRTSTCSRWRPCRRRRPPTPTPIFSKPACTAFHSCEPWPHLRARWLAPQLNSRTGGGPPSPALWPPPQPAKPFCCGVLYLCTAPTATPPTQTPRCSAGTRTPTPCAGEVGPFLSPPPSGRLCQLGRCACASCCQALGPQPHLHGMCAPPARTSNVPLPGGAAATHE